MKVLERKLEKLEKINIQKLPKILRQNIQQISKLIGLNSVEKDILVFSIYLHYYDMLNNAARTLDDLSTEKAIVVLSVLLKHPASKIKKALLPRSKLSQSGMVSIDRNGSSSLGSKIDILSSEFSDKMMNLSDDVEEMIRDSVRKCEVTTLKMNDYSYLDKDLNILIPYLQNALMKKEKGVNILFYGKPGTGKTELTKAIAKKLKVDIYEVSYADEDDEPISGTRRLKAYKVGQSFFSNNNIILMFDEIEDVVGGNDAVSFFAPPKQLNKGWMNRMLENNPIPSIWITNDIYSMDSALVRRYDMAIEIPIPPKAKRKDIIKKECGDMLDETTIDKIAANEAIAPALISRAAKVVSGTGKIDNKDAALENIINHTLKAQGYPKIQNNTEEALPESYDPSYINTDTNLEELAQGIKDYPNARICLYGVSGKGKSAFGKWIAQYTDRPFILKKGSDLISKWVGGIEQNIANAFSEAKEEGAVLVFDEVDSFLQDRRGAKNSWEVTQVNEMLVQMENFNGIFIATTNLMSGLD
jgi:SpoVK/Ycf46/Vps4 family AAA+-type ATPase